MSTDSVLGESWVVASSPTSKEDKQSSNSTPRAPSQKHPAPSKGKCRDDHGSESTISASSMSGPELIMPSIYEAPVSEASWVAPTVRPKQTNPSLRRRHQTPHEPVTAKESDKPIPDNQHPPAPKERKPARSRLLEISIRTVTNILLLTAIGHLLVVPELVQQYQTLCAINTVSALYPSSCIPPFPQPLSTHQQSSSRYESVVSSQTRLKTLFNATLLGMAPLNSSLKHTESRLRDVERALKQAHPGTKHELDLEFASCWQAIRIAAWKYDSLKADLQSAVDSLVAAGGVRAITGSSSIAQDARISTQISRREQYLEQLTTRMRSKADSLAADLTTLDDHLESIESILVRETKLSSSRASTSAGPDDPSQEPFGSHLWTIFDAILPPNVNVPGFLRPATQDTNDGKDGPTTSSNTPLSQVFQDALTYHRPVADLARNLSIQLRQTLQPRKQLAL